MITLARGDLLADEVEALVNPVNTVGVIGKGLALAFKRAYPAKYAAYAAEANTVRRAAENVNGIVLVRKMEKTFTIAPFTS